MAKKKFTFEPYLPMMRASRFGTRLEIPAALLFGTAMTFLYFKPNWNKTLKKKSFWMNKNLYESYLIQE